MNGSLYEQIGKSAEFLNLDLKAEEIAQYARLNNLTEKDLTVLSGFFDHLQRKKSENIINTLLKMSRIPQKNPKIFANYDFNRITGEHSDVMRNLPTLSALYSRKNIAFIGPPGLGKTHLAMAYGNECCRRGLKTYYLKATELNDRLTKARRMDHVSSTVNGLIKPSCLIIDEVGRCVFDRENTRLFFDVIDRRTEKEGPNSIIFTSNKMPNEWKNYFQEDDSLLCALDRIFDSADVFIMKGDSYRGGNLKKYIVDAEPRK